MNLEEFKALIDECATVGQVIGTYDYGLRRLKVSGEELVEAIAYADRRKDELTPRVLTTDEHG